MIRTTEVVDEVRYRPTEATVRRGKSGSALDRLQRGPATELFLSST